MKGTAIKYSDEELRWIKGHKTLVRRIAHAEFAKRFDRPDVSLNNYVALCKRRGWLTGRNGKFHAGQKSWNKGKKVGLHPNSAKTTFKKGAQPHNTRQLGDERVSKDGYVEICVPEVNPHTGFRHRFVQKHRWLWEKQNGPVPDGHCLKCLDGDKTNTDPANWQCIPRAILPRLNARWSGVKYDDAEPDVKPAVMAIARLDHAIKSAQDHKKERI